MEEIALQRVDNPIVQWSTYTHNMRRFAQVPNIKLSNGTEQKTMWHANPVWLLIHAHIWTTLTSTMFQGGRYDQKGSVRPSPSNERDGCTLCLMFLDMSNVRRQYTLVNFIYHLYNVKHNFKRKKTNYWSSSRLENIWFSTSPHISKY